MLNVSSEISLDKLNSRLRYYEHGIDFGNIVYRIDTEF